MVISRTFWSSVLTRAGWRDRPRSPYQPAAANATTAPMAQSVTSDRARDRGRGPASPTFFLRLLIVARDGRAVSCLTKRGIHFRRCAERDRHRSQLNIAAEQMILQQTN